MMFGNENEVAAVNLAKGGNRLLSLTNKRLESTINALGRVNLILKSYKTRMVEIVNDDATTFDWNRGGGWLRSNLIDRERKKFGLNDTHGVRVYYYGLGQIKPVR
ncbi:MAG: hypothetical protein J7599_07365 [Niabella sp.]|nr:hypothetical protein [Niabella sp.]